MKTRSDFQQAGDASANPDAPGGWFGDAAENFQKRRFARAIAPDHPDGVPLFDRKTDIAKGPEFFLLLFCGRLFSEWRGESVVQHVPQAAPIPAQIQQRVKLADVLDLDGVAGRMHLDDVGEGAFGFSKIPDARHDEK